MNMNLPVITEVMPVAEIMMASGFFKDTKDVAQAAVKIIAGQELGIGPVAALRGIDIVEGQVSLRSHLVAAMIRKSEKYDYTVNESNEERCVITYYNAAKDIKLGTSIFSMEMAKKAGLAGRKVWQQYPQDMLYNRAMSRGARVYCPDIFLGATYVDGELEHDVEIVGKNGDGTLELKVGTPLPIDELAESVVTGNIEIARDTESGVAFEVTDYAPAAVEPATDKQRSFVLGLLKEAGVNEGYKRRLFDAVYPDGATKDNLMRDIEDMQTYKRIPDKYFGPYVYLLRHDLGVDVEAVKGFCEEYFGKDRPMQLQAKEQRQLAGWLLEHTPPLPLDEGPRDWGTMIQFLAGVSGKAYGTVETWFHARAQGMSEEEINKWASSLSKDEMLEDMTAFEEGQ